VVDLRNTVGLKMLKRKSRRIVVNLCVNLMVSKKV
ncbi:hypothetical protein ISN45_At01g007510, partial [Arabidopsis thaliana x Arabidopsis arenosa]